MKLERVLIVSLVFLSAIILQAHCACNSKLYNFDDMDNCAELTN